MTSNNDTCLLNVMIVKKNTACNKRECAVCYKPIQKQKFAQCSAPCNQKFHTSCMERIMEQTREAAYENNEKVQHRCCYCRRFININRYKLELIGYQLFYLNASGYYDVSDALKQLKEDIKTDQDNSEDNSYVYYQIRDTTYVKKPKQCKRIKIQKKTNHEPRIRIKQNIGGRRR